MALHGIEVKSRTASPTLYQRFTDTFVNMFGVSGTGRFAGETIGSATTVYVSSFASLTDSDGSYIQVGGGGVTCLVERFDASSGVRQRGYHKPNAAFPDGTILVFGGGQIPMKSDEWFMAGQVVEIFLAYLKKASEPEYLRWRSAPGF